MSDQRRYVVVVGWIGKNSHFRLMQEQEFECDPDELDMALMGLQKAMEDGTGRRLYIRSIKRLLYDPGDPSTALRTPEGHRAFSHPGWDPMQNGS